MKRILAFLSASVILLSLSSAQASVLPNDQQATLEDCGGVVEYNTDAQGGAVIVGYTGSAQEVVIPEKLDGYTVTGIGEKAFYKREEIKSILLPDTLRMIGDYAFYGCKGLGMIKLPPFLETISRWAFVACDSIEFFAIPPTVSQIGDGAFSACKKLNAILTQKGNPVFQSVDGVLMNRMTGTLVAYPQAKPNEKVTIEGGTLDIAPRAFAGNELIREVVLPSTLTEIGDAAFSGCSSLARADLPSGLQKIGTAAFYWCRKLEPSAIPKTVETIMPLAFSNCLSAPSFTVEEGNPFFSSRDGVLYDSLNAALIAYPLGSPALEFSVPEGTRGIGQDAFMNCVTLRGITLPEGLEAIGQNAFRNCDSLETLYVPLTVGSIGKDAFTQWEGNLTLKVREGSPAHLFATENRLPFEVLP